MECRSQNIKIFTAFILCQLVAALLAEISDLIVRNSGQDGIDDFDSFQEKIILVLFVGPVFETLVFNFLLNEFLIRYLRNSFYCILISSFLFGLIHYYSLTYIIITFFAGLVFNGFYFWLRRQKGPTIASLGVLFLHFNHNFIGLLLGK